ncbi:MAG: thiamine pyrophosphate-binding protein [Paenibacillaceae bacterium]|nr:thiamine pyrophosphate-binding protein [Paenibacillaceae bacterium]
MPSELILEKGTESSRAPLSSSRTVAAAILEQLQLWGVQRIYGVAGDAIFGLLDAIAGQTAIRFVSVKHESVAALMASADAKCMGGLGVCAAQMGPGLANLLNGLGDAYMDGASVLAITGQAPLRKIGTHYKQYINQQQMVQSVTDYSELVTHPDAVIPCVSRAIHVTMTLKSVSHLSIPADVFGLPTSVRPFPPIRVPQVGPGDEEIEGAAQMLRQAERPMMLVGAGAGARNAAGPIQRLAESWGCGIAIGYGATGVIPADTPHLLGGLGEGGNPYLTGRFKEADAVLVIGTSWWPANSPMPRDVGKPERAGGLGRRLSAAPVAHRSCGRETCRTGCDHRLGRRRFDALVHAQFSREEPAHLAIEPLADDGLRFACGDGGEPLLSGAACSLHHRGRRAGDGAGGFADGRPIPLAGDRHPVQKLCFTDGTQQDGEEGADAGGNRYYESGLRSTRGSVRLGRLANSVRRRSGTAAASSFGRFQPNLTRCSDGADSFSPISNVK